MTVAALLLLGACIPLVPACAMGVRSGQAPPAAGESGVPEGEYRPGEVIVQFRAGATAAEREAVLNRHGLRIRHTLGTGGDDALLAELPEGAGVAAVVARLQAEPTVRAVSPNYITRLNPPGEATPVRRP